MEMKICKECKYCSWMVGIGFGIRCTKEENQVYKKDKKNNLPVIIGFVPSDCEYFENMKNDFN